MLADEQGADGVELDVRIDRTGELLVRHDPLPRRSSGTDALPTLATALDACGDEMLVNVEIKNLASDGGFDASMSIAHHTIDELRRRGAQATGPLADLVVLVGDDHRLPRPTPATSRRPTSARCSTNGRSTGSPPPATRPSIPGSGSVTPDARRAMSRGRPHRQRVDVERSGAAGRTRRLRCRRRVHRRAGAGPARARS